MKNFFEDSRFLYGASVAPYAKSADWPAEEYEQDMKELEKLNFNVIRIFVPQDRIEYAEHRYDFSRQDAVMDLAARHGIGVLLTVGGVFDNLQGIYPPQWLARDYPVLPPQTSPGVGGNNSGPRVRICLDDPLWRNRAFEFIALAVRRYAEHPAVLGWMNWNEPWLGCCYCGHTRNRFRHWLKERYRNNLETMLKAWSTEFPVLFRDWDEVEPPQGCGFLYGGFIAWRDWHEFNQFRLSEAMGEIRRIIHENDPYDRPVTGNICLTHGFRGVFPEVNVRPSEVAKSFDIPGFSYYTVAHGEGRWLTPFTKSLYVDSFRWMSRDPLRRTLVLETEVGPNVAMLTPQERIFNNWLAIGHNVKSFVCWNYRTRISDNQVANFNLMRWNGTPSARARLHAEQAELLSRHAALLNTACPRPAAAVLVSDRLMTLLMSSYIQTGDGKIISNHYEDGIENSIRGAFKALWDMNIPYDGISEFNLGELKRYRLLLLPAVENMTQEIADAIRDFTANGGTVIAESPFAFKDGNNMFEGYAPICGLEQVFGVTMYDREGRETAPAMEYPAGKAPCFFYWHVLEPAGELEATVPYEDGRCAISCCRFGKGTAILAGTEIFRQYYESPAAPAVEWLREAILASGVARNAELLQDGRCCDGTGIEVCRLFSDSAELCILLNHNREPQKFRLVLEREKEWSDLVAGTPAPLDQELELPGLGVRVLQHRFAAKQ